VPAERARCRALVRALVLDDSLGLGMRRRRYEHARPADWQPLPMGLITEWYPPGFPNDAAVITVFPASVASAKAPRLFDAMLARIESAGGRVVARPQPEAFEGRNGLRGRHHSATIERSGPRPLERRTMVIFDDGRFVYPLDLVSQGAGDDQAHRDVFLALAASVIPIPAGAADQAWLAQAMHWTV
jgi:hypothetical protein